MASTTRLSSKGQVVVPARLRRALGWVPGQRLVAEIDPGDDRTLVLRGGAADDVEGVLARGYAWFERGQPDPVEALHESRRTARARERRRR